MSIKQLHMIDDIELINTVLHIYFKERTNIKKLSLGNVNNNYLIECNNSKYVLRHYLPRTHFERSKSAIEKELEIILLADSNNIPVAKPIKNRNGEYLTEMQNELFVLFEFCEGKSVYGELLSDHFYEIGSLMANFHNISERLNLQCDYKWEGEGLWSYLQRKIESSDDNQWEIIWANIEKHLNILQKTKQHLVHGDFHFGNILFKDNGKIAALLDFDDYRMDHFADDIVRFFACDLAYTDEKYYKLTKEFVKTFFDGYLMIRKFSTNDILLIFVYLDIQHLYNLIKLAKHKPEKLIDFDKNMNILKKYFKNVLG